MFPGKCAKIPTFFSQKLKNMKTIISINTHVGNDNNNQKMMTSLEIAELTGKQHKDVLKAIRKMELAWEDVTGRKFALRMKINELANGVKIETPFYSLTKTECLYIATKFNDEARAKLVLRWEELERANALNEKLEMRNEKFLPSPKEILRLADEIIGEGLRMLNEDAEDTLTATQVAKTFNMSVWDFNQVLRDMGIQYRRNGRWNLCDDLDGRDFVRLRTHVSYSLKGEKKVKTYMTWTISGLRYLNSRLGYPNF